MSDISPKPWQIKKNEVDNEYYLVDANGVCGCDLFLDTDTEHMVKCVNEYDGLIEEIKLLKQDIEYEQMMNACLNSRLGEVIANIEQYKQANEMLREEYGKDADMIHKLQQELRQVKQDNARLTLEGLNACNIAINLEQQLHEAIDMLSKCSPFQNDAAGCFCCGTFFTSDHEDDCAYIKLIGRSDAQ
jgi:hypothetical protein